MKPQPAALQRALPDLPGTLISEHVNRLPDSYFERFDAAAIAAHLRALASLSPLLPAEALLREVAAGQIEVTFVGLDAPGLFSLLTGVLMSLGFSIASGEVYTYAPAPPGRRPRSAADPYRRRRIVDLFLGRVDTLGSLAAWTAELRQRLVSTVGLLERHAPDGLQLARKRVNEWVTERLEQTGPARPRSPFVTGVELQRLDSGAVLLRVESEDTPAFLYSLSTALALHEVSIRRVRIETRDGKVHDELEVELAPGSPAASEEQLRTAVLLTKQFTYFLDSAPDPYAALTRFDWLATQVAIRPGQSSWLALLAEPGIMPDLARLLGASDFMWEDFIRQRYDEVLAALHARKEPAAARQQPRLDEALAGKNPEDQRKIIVAYRDRQAFLVQLEGILDESGDPAALSRRLTGLAEDIVRASVAVLYAELEQRRGPPGVPFAVFALGKFGAAALGYASDLELLLVHGGSSPSAFFAELLELLQGMFRGKQEGLFELDLRLRPWGKNAVLDCPIATFEAYYGPRGPAHSLERIALTRLRAIGGDPDFGARVERLRDDLIYERPWLSLEELAETRSRQFQQKHAGARNAKYSAGALVDLEYGVQILQVLHAGNHPSLRTPDLNAAIAELGRLRMLEPGEAARLADTYLFLRRLVNALRMLHGVAEELDLPAPDSSASRYLARRLGYHHLDWKRAEEDLERDFASSTAFVRSFVRQHVGAVMLPAARHAGVA
jgi:glutamate-ammonia-ligase adenylyltransferase